MPQRCSSRWVRTKQKTSHCLPRSYVPKRQPTPITHVGIISRTKRSVLEQGTRTVKKGLLLTLKRH